MLRRRATSRAALPAGLRGSAVGTLGARLAALEASHSALNAALAAVARDVQRTRAKLRASRRDDAGAQRAAEAQLARHEEALLIMQGAPENVMVCRVCRSLR